MWRAAPDWLTGSTKNNNPQLRGSSDQPLRPPTLKPALSRLLLVGAKRRSAYAPLRSCVGANQVIAHRRANHGSAGLSSHSPRPLRLQRASAYQGELTINSHHVAGIAIFTHHVVV
ncbi:hypothetical protein VTN96DRAFT_8824 [Rasamsonia emersonii]